MPPLPLLLLLLAPVRENQGGFVLLVEQQRWISDRQQKTAVPLKLVPPSLSLNLKPPPPPSLNLSVAKNTFIIKQQQRWHETLLNRLPLTPPIQFKFNGAKSVFITIFFLVQCHHTGMLRKSVNSCPSPDWLVRMALDWSFITLLLFPPFFLLCVHILFEPTTKRSWTYKLPLNTTRRRKKKPQHVLCTRRKSLSP